MAAAQIGPVTTVAEAVATAVAAGILLGGFAAGSVGILARWTRPKLDQQILVSGYAGGIAGILLVLMDLTVRYHP